MPRGKAKRVNNVAEAFIGGEPSFNPEQELSNIDVIVAMNWYNAQIDSKEAKSFLLEHLYNINTPKKTVRGFSKIADADCRTVGVLARMQSRGAKLSPAHKETFDCALMGLISAAESENVSENEQQEVVTKKPNVQDYMRAQANNVIGELEEALDKRDYSTKAISAIKGPHQSKWVLDWLNARGEEFRSVISTKDEQIREGYSNYSKKEIKEVINFIDVLSHTLQTQKAIQKQTRKPRAKKQKSAQEVVGSVKYLKSEPSLKVTSVHPSEIVGAQQLWVFNVKYRKLGVFNAADPQGLVVKGTTVKNFDEAKSFSKTLRKPEKSVPELLASGKVALRHFMSNIRAKESTLKGRLNEDVLLLKVVK